MGYWSYANLFVKPIPRLYPGFAPQSESDNFPFQRFKGAIRKTTPSLNWKLKHMEFSNESHYHHVLVFYENNNNNNNNNNLSNELEPMRRKQE